MSDERWLGGRRWCYRSSPVHRFDQQRQLRRGQRHRAIDDRRPHEAALLQPFGEETQAAAVPVQRLQVVAALAAKEEEVTAEAIGADDLLRLGGQPSKPFRRSTGWQARKTLVPGARLITPAPSSPAARGATLSRSPAHRRGSAPRSAARSRSGRSGGPGAHQLAAVPMPATASARQASDR